MYFGMYFAQQDICDSSHLRPPKLDPWHQAQLSVGNPSPGAVNVNWVTYRTNLGRPELHMDDEKRGRGFMPAGLAGMFIRRRE
jgi:hypothetical protein